MRQSGNKSGSAEREKWNRMLLVVYFVGGMTGLLLHDIGFFLFAIVLELFLKRVGDERDE